MYDEKRITENLKYWKINGFDKEQAIERVIGSYGGAEYEYVRSLAERVYARNEMSPVVFAENQKDAKNGKKIVYSFVSLLLLVCVIAFCVFSAGSGGNLTKTDLVMEITDSVSVDGKIFRTVYYVYDYDKTAIEGFPYAAVRIGEKDVEGVRPVNGVEFFYSDEEPSDDDFSRFLKNIAGDRTDEFFYDIDVVRNYAAAIGFAEKQYLAYEAEFPSMTDLNKIYLIENGERELDGFEISEEYEGVAFKGLIKDLMILSQATNGTVIVEKPSPESGGNFRNGEDWNVYPVISRQSFFLGNEYH